MRTSKTDPQKYKVYALEAKFLGAWLEVRQPLHALQQYADRACKRWSVEPVPVRFVAQNPEGLYGCYWGYPDSTPRIELYNKKRNSGRNLPVLLHEVGHHIETELYDGEYDHGPKFTAICMDLFDYYKVVPAAQYRKLAKKFKVKIAQL